MAHINSACGLLLRAHPGRLDHGSPSIRSTTDKSIIRPSSGRCSFVPGLALVVTS